MIISVHCLFTVYSCLMLICYWHYTIKYCVFRNALLYEIDLATTLCTRQLKGHSTSINKVQAGNSKIVTVSDDQTVCVWYKSGAVPTQVNYP